MILTASLVMPSPKTIEKSLGCSSNLIILTAATTSEEHMREERSMISSREGENLTHSPVDGIHFVIGMY